MKVIVKRSRIEGKGVFAARDFKKGETIIKWDITKQLSQEEAKKVSDEDKKYIAYTQGKIIMLQDPEKYVNHSCEPNTNVKNFSDVAIKDIQKGEEITSDYSQDLSTEEEMKCNCGSKNCRKFIIRK